METDAASSHSSPALPRVASLDATGTPTLADYVAASAEYIRGASQLTSSAAKTAQLALSKGLSNVMANDLCATGVPFTDLRPGEREVGGGLRAAKADVSEMTPRDGLTVGVEIKPVHLAVGRAIWNRMGDIRAFALNVHLKFPFAVVGGVLTVPTSERKTSGNDSEWKSTLPAVQKAIKKFSAAGERRSEYDAPHLLEATAVVVFDVDSGLVRDDLPGETSPLSWGTYIDQLAAVYDLRFND
jgi:hypothetical protein